MITEFKRDVSNWILDWVSAFNESMGQIPCPFARKALLDGQIDWRFVESMDDLEKIRTSLYFDREIVIVGFQPSKFTVDEIGDFVDRFNEDYMPKGIVALDDHPSDEQTAAGVKMNQGEWGWIGIQRLDKLDRASAMLSKLGYYDKWSDDEFKDVVSWRHEEGRRKVSYKK